MTTTTTSQGRWLPLCGASAAVLHLTVYLAQRIIHRGPLLGGRLSFAAALAAYVAAMLGLFAIYGFVVRACALGRIATRQQRWLAIMCPVVFNVLLLPVQPALSIDIYAYIVHGYLLTVLGKNPYLFASRAAIGTPIERELIPYGWAPVQPPSPYGPVLTHVEHLVARLGNVPLEILAFKTLAVVATLASAAVIWRILGRIRPRKQVFGTVLFLWNPMITWELAGEAHNDALMMLLVLLAIASLLEGRDMVATGVLSLAALTKYVPLMLVPLMAVYLLRTRRVDRRFFARAVFATLIAVSIATVLFFPLWAGVDTFRGVQLNGGAGDSGSTPTLAIAALRHVAPSVEWRAALWPLEILALFACIIWSARQVTDTPSFLRAACIAWLLYVLLISPAYWPWYAATVVALLALVPERAFVKLALVVSLASALAAPMTMVYVHGLISRQLFLGAMWGVGIALPLLVLSWESPAIAVPSGSSDPRPGTMARMRRWH